MNTHNTAITQSVIKWQNLHTMLEWYAKEKFVPDYWPSTKKERHHEEVILFAPTTEKLLQALRDALPLVGTTDKHNPITLIGDNNMWIVARDAVRSFPPSTAPILQNANLPDAFWMDVVFWDNLLTNTVAEAMEQQSVTHKRARPA